jgi:hypothetical protein
MITVFVFLLFCITMKSARRRALLFFLLIAGYSSHARHDSGSGIYRQVRITVKDPLQIDPSGVTITTPVAGPGKATVNLDALLRNGGTSTADVVLSARIIDRKGRVVAAKEMSIWLPAKGESHVTPSFTIDRPLLWSVDSPNLYRLRLVLIQGGIRKDTYTTTFGIRTTALTGTIDKHGIIDPNAANRLDIIHAKTAIRYAYDRKQFIHFSGCSEKLSPKLFYLGI